MRVVIVGSGVVGTASAWYLHEAGHEVVVVDRSAGPARETSFANAGQISPGYASPWASPKIPLQLLYWLPQKHAPLVLRPKFDSQQMSWLFAMLRNCSPTAYARNKERMVRLAEFSRDELRRLRTETGIAYGWVTECLKRGAYFHPYHNMFISAAHTETEIKATLEITDQAFEAAKRNRDSYTVHPIVQARFGS